MNGFVSKIVNDSDIIVGMQVIQVIVKTFNTAEGSKGSHFHGKRLT